ncbi:MAG: hypothetical protein LW699_09225, partial [Pirellula sp.]|nr:hypothetical protein [Pirellula sp.]
MNQSDANRSPQDCIESPIEWLDVDPEALAWIQSIETADDPTAQAQGELERELLGTQEDAAALEVLRRYYHRERLRHTLANHRQELPGPAYRACLSDTA